MKLSNFKTDFQSFNFYFAFLIAVFLPFKFLISPLIGGWVILKLFFFRKTSWKSILNNGIAICSLLFFLAHLFAYFFSNNNHEALFSIELKLSFLFLPILFATSGFESKIKNKLLFSFVFANSIAVLICLTNSLFNLYKNHELLTYNNFCLFMHPGYFSMYLCFSILTLLYRIKDFDFLNNNKLVIGLLFIVLLTGIFLAASKMGILAFLILVPFAMLFQLWKNKNYLSILISMSLILISSLYFIKSDSLAAARLRSSIQFFSSDHVIDKTTTESNAVRVLIWQQAIQLIKERPFLGYTPGDVNDKLYTSYNENGLSGAFENRLNAHNQFLQSTLGIGVIGFSLLVSLILLTVYNGIRHNDTLIVFFAIIILFNFFVESMLQTSAGTLFFVFFISLFTITKNNLSEKES